MRTCSETNRFALLEAWLRESAFHWQCLEVAESKLHQDWVIGAGFLRNLIWDRMHDLAVSRPEDIDVLVLTGNDKELSNQLCESFPANWSVKNQLNMHKKRGLPRCIGFDHAMTFWPERETAIAVSLRNNELQFHAPFTLEPAFSLSVSATPWAIDNPADCQVRFAKKNWQQQWPKLSVEPIFTKS